MMKINLLTYFVGVFFFIFVPYPASTQYLPSRPDVIKAMKQANRYFMNEWPDPSVDIVTNVSRPSNIWTRAVYYEGLMAFEEVAPDSVCVNYAIRWAQAHRWGLRGGILTHNADNQACAQTYIALYKKLGGKEKIAPIDSCLALIMKDPISYDWSWIDALQMAMPVWASMGELKQDSLYLERMYLMYQHARDEEAGHGLYSPTAHLWWRDKDFLPPYREPNGRDCFWSRGNGWVLAALVRVLERIPVTERHRHQYQQDLSNMIDALLPLQREDGFWNVSLLDSSHFGGKELTGTALFTYGMAWAINNGIVDRKKYIGTVFRAWNGMVRDALHPDGMLGFVQGSGKEPADGQPVQYNHRPDFDDFGLGCFLLAGSEVYKLLK